ncbi:MAG: hypothetical protein IKT38_01815 [Clostridia bacterium]|nr:hypothetical protein [Clostridia bacterium]
MSNIKEALEILLNESEPVIYDYDESPDYTFVTIGYTGSRYFTLPIEMLIDDSDENTLSLVGHPDNVLNIDKKTAKNYLWFEMLMNDLNLSLSTENRKMGVWCCYLEGGSLEDALDLKGKVTVQFVINIPKNLDTKSMAELLKVGVESFKSSVGRIQRFIHKCQTSESALDFDDVFPEKSDNVEIRLHPKFLDILNHSDENEQPS